MRIIFLFSILCLIQASSCRRDKDECPANFLDKGDDRLTIVNSTSENITFTMGYDYPNDTNRMESYVPTETSVNVNPGFNVGPNSSKKYRAGSCWESRFRILIPSGKLRIVFVNIDSLKTYPAAEIISRGLYKSYLYTLDELKANDWQVVYP